jgi:Ca2+-transporting ATPase
MDAAPRSGDDTILERRDWEDIGVYGAIIALAVGGGFGVALGPGELPTDKAVTVSFLSLSIARLLHVFNMRRADSGVWLNEISKNPYVWGALALDVGLLVMAVYIPLLAGVLSLTPPGWIGWCIVIATSVVPLLMGQLYLALRGPSR